MLLEGLTANEALQRVREQHPWAKPDSYHWLALRWLEKNKEAENYPIISTKQPALMGPGCSGPPEA